MPTDLDDFQRRVAEWGNRTFPDSTPQSKFWHLFGEVNHELRRELFWSNGRRRRRAHIDAGCVAEEAADIFMMLLHMCAEQGVSLAAAAEAKFAVVQTRRWGPPDEHGVVEHVRGADDDGYCPECGDVLTRLDGDLCRRCLEAEQERIEDHEEYP